MSGEHLADLMARVAGMNSDDVLTSQTAWASCGDSLELVAVALDDASPKVRDGFGRNSDVGIEAETSFTTAAQRIRARQGQLVEAGEVLSKVWSAMRAAQNVADTAPTDPGDRPELPPSTGDRADDITDLKQHISRVNIYDKRLEAYGDANADALKKVQRIIENYTEASAVFSSIHGDASGPGPIDHDGPGGDPGGRPPRPGTSRGEVLTLHWGEVVPQPPRHENPNPELQPEPEPHPILNPNPHPNPNPTPTPTFEPGPQGPGGNPAVLGGLGAGVFGAPGLVNGVRSLLGSRGAGGGPASAIGSTTRAGGPGSLGRTAAGVPGSPVGRGSGATGARSAATPGGGSGNRSGGRSGGRSGAGAAGAGGRSDRRRNERRDGERDLFDDGQDWLDDEGTAPGLLD